MANPIVTPQIEAHRASVLDALRTGKSLGDLALPATLIAEWRQASRIFDAEVSAAIFSARQVLPQARPVPSKAVRGVLPRGGPIESPQVRQEILARLRSGSRIISLGLELPHRKIIAKYRLRDANFDAECVAAMAEAQHARSQKKPPLWNHGDAGMKARILDELRAGVPLAHLGSDFPAARVIYHWRQYDQLFDAEVIAALEAGAAFRPRHLDPRAIGRRRSSFRRIHERTPELRTRILEAIRDGGRAYKLGAGLPSNSVITDWRKCDPGFDAQIKAATTGTSSLYAASRTPEMRAAIMAALGAGRTIKTLGAGLPTRSGIRRWRLADPDFDAEIRRFIVSRRVAARPKLPKVVSIPVHIQARRTNDIYAAAELAVSRSYPPDIRDDIITDVVILLLEGEFGIGDIKGAAKKATTAYWNGREGYRQSSLDAPMFSDSSKTMQDVIGGF